MITAFFLGLFDALAQGGYLSTGRTWDDDQDKNEAYDHGANVGEAIARPFIALRERCR